MVESTERRLITISIPVLNEEENVGRLMHSLQAVASKHPEFDFEFLVTDNASGDNTFANLAEYALSEPRLRVLRFTRNFGFQQSILTNLLNARGAAAIQIDADLQDPPELISTFLQKWQEGYSVVYGIRRTRKENLLLRTARHLHYRLIRWLSEVDVPLDAGDFRLVDRAIIEELRQWNDRTPYLRGLIASIGGRQIGIPYDRAARSAGRTKFNLFSLIRLSIDGVCGQSTKPLQFITFFGMSVSLLTLFSIIIYLGLFFFQKIEAEGFTTLVLLILASIGLNSAFIGIIGEYVGRTYSNVRGGPVVIIADRIETSTEGINLPHQ